VLVGYLLTLIQLRTTDNRAWRGVSKDVVMVPVNSISLHEESEGAQSVDRSRLEMVTTQINFQFATAAPTRPV
jgi:hypothetical protein